MDDYESACQLGWGVYASGLIFQGFKCKADRVKLRSAMVAVMKMLMGEGVTPEAVLLPAVFKRAQEAIRFK